MRILLIGSTPPPYHGSTLYFKNFLEALAKQAAFEVFHVETSDKRNDLNNIGKFDFKNISTALSALVKEIYVCAKYRPEVVYIPIAQNTWAYLRDGLFIVIGKLFKARVVVHLHGSYFRVFYDKSAWPIKKFIDATIGACDGAIVLGNKLRWIFEKWLPSDRIFILPNFVMDDPNPRKGYDKPCKVITYLGNVYESKGIFDLLDAIKVVNERAKGTLILQVAGGFVDDPFTPMTSEMAQRKFEEYRKILNGTLKYRGQITTAEDKYRLLEETDLFVFPSWYANEGQPLVLLEAMAAGCPVISTKGVGAIEETVIEGVTGMLVEKQNPEELAKAIWSLMENPELCKQMGRAGRKRYEACYTPERALERVLTIFKTVLNSSCAL